MKIAEISGGAPATLRVRSTGNPFVPLPQREDEVALLRSADQTLLQLNDAVWAVEGVTPSETTALEDVVTSGRPTLAFVAQATTDILVIEARTFPDELRIVEPMQLGLDEKILEDVRRAHRVGGTVADVAAWLEDQLLAPAAPRGPAELRRLIISGDARGRLDVFRVYGQKIAADIRRADDKLRIERVVRGGRGGNQRLIVLHAPASIVDSTLAAEVHGAVRTALSEAVTKDASYLRTWQEYQKLERETILRRARTFGALEYRSCERRRDGGFRFDLAPLDDLSARMALLGEWDRFELEAGPEPPKLDKDAPTSDSPRKPKASAQRLSAAILDVDERRQSIDLAPPDEDEDQPTPPRSGYLYLSLGGDEARLRRRERAEEALRTGNCPLPQLGLLMEGRPAPAARRSKISVHGPKLWPIIREVFEPSRPTQRQLEAIEIALNTPDVALIQGPPGTGKTKVITAIERCLAVLADEGVELSHRILVSAAQHDAVENVAQRSEVFGLPAVKIGRRRRGSDTTVDPADADAEKRLSELRARIRTPPEAERLSQARRLAVACFRARSLPAEQAQRIRDITRALGDLLPPDLRDRALERASSLDRPVSAGNPEETKLMIQAARGVRVDEGSFSDDGPIQARKARRRLEAILTPEERAFLERCEALEPGQVPPWLGEGQAHKDAILDRLTQPPVVEPRHDDETQRLLQEILDTVDRRLALTRAGEDAALAAYLHDLETDPEGVREALQHYTVVLASTLQHAASNQMRRARGIDEGQATFESVIVDEAARANPLDLFIPLSMARRRVVLVGDHRQLPHLLEPDVERELAEGVEKGTVLAQTLEAVKASLFERLWVLLRALESKDAIRRTITLNTQYRMHPELGRFVSRELYEVHEDGAIESPRRAAEFAHDLPGYSKNGAPCAAAWIDVPNEGKGDRERRGISKSRPVEARVIAREVRRLIEHDSTLTFGVIAFYAEQVSEIGQAMIDVGLTERTDRDRGFRVAERWASTLAAGQRRAERLRIGTVDAFQGKEFDVVFLSVTRSNDLLAATDEQQRRKYGHLMLENRLCVAMSRQQRLLVTVGDLKFVMADEAKAPLRALRAFAELCGGEYGIVR